MTNDDNEPSVLPSLDLQELVDVPVFTDVPSLPDTLQTFRQALAQTDARHRRPMTRWTIVVALLRDHDVAARDLAERLAAWPTSTRRHLMSDHPSERADRAEQHRRGLQTRARARRARADAEESGGGVGENSCTEAT